MGDRFWLQVNCGGCGEKNPSDKEYKEDPMENGIYYAPSSGAMDFKCSKCGKTNWIESGYRGRVVTEKELNELYESNGFVNFVNMEEEDLAQEKKEI